MDFILITNLTHWLLFIHKILFSSTCFEPQVLIFRRIQLYTCSIWYCHSLWEFLVAYRYTAWVRASVLTQAVYRQVTKNSHREWQYHMLHVHNCILLKISTWGSKHVEENNILWINNNQCIKLVINIYIYIYIYTRYTHRICTHLMLFSTATMVARTCIKVTLHVHWLSCYYSVTNVKCMVFNEHRFGISKITSIFQNLEKWEYHRSYDAVMAVTLKFTVF